MEDFKKLPKMAHFKDGGKTGVYGAKKTAGDLDSIKKAKDIVPVKLCGGSKVKRKK